jgi:hypothetical protein
MVNESELPSLGSSKQGGRATEIDGEGGTALEQDGKYARTRGSGKFCRWSQDRPSGFFCIKLISPRWDVRSIDAGDGFWFSTIDLLDETLALTAFVTKKLKQLNAIVAQSRILQRK